MKLTKFSFFLTLGFFFLLLASSCREEECMDPRNPECENYDPCIDVVETSADFGFFRKFPHESEERIWLAQKDTFYLGSTASTLFFRAKNSKMSAYEWRVGLDPRTFTDSLFYLEFGNTSVNLNVTLNVINEKADADCFSLDTGYVEMTKSIYLKEIPVGNSWPMPGNTYRGYNEDNPEHIWEVYIDEYNKLVNFPDGCPHLNGMLLAGGPKRKWISTNVDNPSWWCGNPKGDVVLQDDLKTLIIDYTIEEPEDSGIRVAHRWVGTKIE